MLSNASLSSAMTTETAAMEATALGFNDVEDETLALVLSFLAARDVEAVTVASRVVALGVVPRFPAVWRSLFCDRWETLNFPLAGVRDGSARLQLSADLDALFPGNCTTSRKFQLLAHAVTPVPSSADLARTRKSPRYSETMHRLISLGHVDLQTPRTVDFAFDGRFVGDDRTVRANVPFPLTIRVAVYCRRLPSGELLYEVGVVSSGYFEYSIKQRAHSHSSINHILQEDMTAIGLVAERFPLVGRQPGWRGRSYGYHGDDGRFFDSSMQGEVFGSRFGAGDTVGCGVRNTLSTGQMSVFFTKNGQLVTSERIAPTGFIACSQRAWYPAVGLDSYDHIHMNFGQEPFVAPGVVDQLFSECRGLAAMLPQHLQWYDIRESDAESDWEDEAIEDDESDNELMMTDVTAFILRALERHRGRPA